MEDAMHTAINITEQISFSTMTSRSERQHAETAEQLEVRALDEALTEALMESFPASDPISSLRPA
jgi:hypothetical protein